MYNRGMIRAVIFDCFGVIISDALSLLVEELAVREPAKVAEMRAVAHAANKGIVSPEASTARIAELLGMSVEAYRQRIREGEVRDQRVLDYAKALRTQYKTALLSNITQQGIERRFPNDELHSYFDAVIVSSEIGYAKPEAQAYQIAAERLQALPGECVFIDDRADYVAAAQQVGMQGVVYTTFGACQQALTEVLHQA